MCKQQLCICPFPHLSSLTIDAIPIMTFGMCPLEAVQVSELEVTWCTEKPHFSVNDRRGIKADTEKLFGDLSYCIVSIVSGDDGVRGLRVFRVSSIS